MKRAKGLKGCDRSDLDRGEMGEFQWCKQIENQTNIKKVASKKYFIIGGSFRVTLVVGFGFCSHNFGNWWGPMNAIIHSMSIDEVVVIILKSGGNSLIHSINFNDHIAHSLVWMQGSSNPWNTATSFVIKMCRC